MNYQGKHFKKSCRESWTIWRKDGHSCFEHEKSSNWEYYPTNGRIIETLTAKSEMNDADLLYLI